MIKCKKCGLETERYNGGLLCHSCYNEYMRLKNMSFRKIFPDNHRKAHKKWVEKYRKPVFEYYGNKCMECGCPNILYINPYSKKQINILEINHINGGGNLDYKNGKVTSIICKELIEGKRKWEDYNLLCKICNIKHYLEVLCNIKGYNIEFINTH